MIAAVLAALAAAPVALEVDACVDAGVGFERQVALELGEPVNATGQASPLTRVHLGCQQQLVVVEVTAPDTGAVTRRRLDPGAVSATARRRLLAIATAEVVGASRLPPATEQARRPAVPPPARQPPRLVAPVEPAAQARLAWVSSVRLRGATYLGAQHAAGGGVAVALERQLAAPLALRAELAVDAALERETLGWLWQLGGSASVGPVVRLSFNWPVTFGLAVRVGLVRLAGAPDDAAASDGFALTGPWVGALGHVGLRLAPAHRAGLTVGLEGGAVVLPFVGLRSDGRRWGVEGGWVSLQVGWELPW